MSNWSLIYDNYDPNEEPRRETLTALGNGYFMTRGASEDSQADEIHYPGTYLAGGYNRLTSMLAGHCIVNEDLVNWPNWIGITFSIDDQHWFNINAVDILDYHQELNLQEGCLLRIIHFQDQSGRETTLSCRRIVHMRHPHLGAIEYKIIAHNWSGTIKIRSFLDGSVINAGVARYRGLNSKHHEVIDRGEFDGNLIYLQVETNQSHIRMSQVIRHQIFNDHLEIQATPQVIIEHHYVAHEYTLSIEKNASLTVEKVMALYSSRDRAVSDGLTEARIACQTAGRFEVLFQTHRQAFQFLWQRCDIRVDSKNNEQLLLRLSIFHLLQTVSFHSTQLDVSVPARGLHGEAYRGHIFWDELFIFPFYVYHFPIIARSLLLYRYERLNMARQLASNAGFRGAMYPWQSGSNGQEETQTLHLNPRSNQWDIDLSHYQRHINAALVYNIWHYYRITQDDEFLNLYGAEMILDIAIFFCSITTFSTQKKRYEILNVVGPDEYHEQYPLSDEHGINNNAYTNIMTVWLLEVAFKVLALLPNIRANELMLQLNLANKEVDEWQRITKNMFIPFHERKIISQFEGYDDLKEFDWDFYEKKYGNLGRLDRILKAEGDSTNDYKLSKQPDVLMLFYLLPKEELKRIFHQLGYLQFDDDCIARTFNYYQKRTSHGSSLSNVFFASELGYQDTNKTQSYLQLAMETDLKNDTTHEGIHLGALASLLTIFQHQYGGAHIINKTPDPTQFYLCFKPNLPTTINRLAFQVQFEQKWYKIELDHRRLRILFESGKGDVSTVYVFDKAIHLKKGRYRNIPNANQF